MKTLNEQRRNSTAEKFTSAAKSAGYQVDHYGYAGRYAPCVRLNSASEMRSLAEKIGWPIQLTGSGRRLSYVHAGQFVVIPFFGKRVAA